MLAGNPGFGEFSPVPMSCRLVPMTMEPIVPSPADTNPPEAPEPAAATLPGGINCWKCSYELHGLTRESLCPECATPIQDSLRSDALIFASPAYLGKLRIGAEMTTWGALSWVFVAGFWWLLQAMAASLVKSLAPTLDADLLAGAAVYLVHFTTALVLVRGIWLLTLPEERYQRRREKRWIRPAARWTLLISSGLQEFALVIMLLDPSFTRASVAVIIFTLATNAVGWAFLLHLVARYYRRGRVNRLAWWAHVAAVTASASPLLILVFSVLTMVMPPLPGPILFAAGFAIGLIPLVVLILLGFTLLVSFIVLVELGSWINKARIRSESIRAALGADFYFLL